MQIVPRTQTKLDPRETARALADVFALVGRRPTLTGLKILLAWIWFETAGAPIGNNPGNRAVAGFVDGVERSSWAGRAWRPPWFDEPGPDASERNRFEHAEMLAGRAPSAFAVFDSIGDGLRDWVALLAHTFPTLLNAAMAGDLPAFSELYRSTRYAPDSTPELVSRNIKARTAELEAAHAFDGIDVAPPGGAAGTEGPAILGVAALTAAVLLWLARRKRS